MSDEIERKASIEEIYLRFDRSPKKGAIELLVRDTMGISIVHLIQVCTRIKNYEDMPKNLGNAIMRERRAIREKEDQKEKESFNAFVDRGQNFTAWFCRFVCRTFRELHGEKYLNYWKEVKSAFETIDTANNRREMEEEIKTFCEEKLNAELRSIPNSCLPAISTAPTVCEMSELFG